MSHATYTVDAETPQADHEAPRSATHRRGARQLRILSAPADTSLTVLEALPSFLRHLAASNKAPATRTTYGKAVTTFDSYLRTAGMPPQLASIRREHVEHFLVALQERQRPATVAQRYRSLQQFFKWAVGVDEIPETPMTRMRPPHVPETPPELITEAQQRALLRACAGKTFSARRDTALIMLFLDTGMRRGEAAGLQLDDLDADHQVALVLGKGRRPRACPYGARTARAMDAYLLARRRHASSHLPWLWLGKRGRLTDTGIEQVVKRRGSQAGIELHPHLFRHVWTHQMLADGVQEGDLLRLGGWRSRQMLERYGASGADERARAAYRMHSPMDRL